MKQVQRIDAEPLFKAVFGREPVPGEVLRIEHSKGREVVVVRPDPTSLMEKIDLFLKDHGIDCDEEVQP